MAYLDDHPPAHQQFRCPRRERPSGVIGVHTAEWRADENPPDLSAEGTADFIRRRGDYGSYHWIVDSDSMIQLIRHSCVAYHIATFGMNEHSIGISAAVQAHLWGSYGEDYVRAVVRNMARAAAQAARWLRSEYGITVPARRLSQWEARNHRPGFIAHADADPDRRTDPGPDFDWSMFFDFYRAEMDGDDMAISDDDLNRMAERMAAVLRQHDGNPIGKHGNVPLSRDQAMLRAAQWSGGTNNRVRYQLVPAAEELLGRPLAEVDEAALAQALAELMPQVDTAAILAAIQALPDAVRAELKAAL